MDPARDVLRLVGAESDDDLTGIVGGKSIVLSDLSDLSERE
jgi:hypothetical protein